MRFVLVFISAILAAAAAFVCMRTPAPSLADPPADGPTDVSERNSHSPAPGQVSVPHIPSHHSSTLSPSTRAVAALWYYRYSAHVRVCSGFSARKPDDNAGDETRTSMAHSYFVIPRALSSSSIYSQCSW